jgi:CRISPR-associated protein Csx10
MELKSDALPGQAESYGSYVDQDIKTDNFGIPYIPARRIKGILRKNASYLESWLNYTPDEIFGKSGMDQEFFHISNGYIEYYEELKALLRSANSEKLDNGTQKELDIIFSKNNVTDLFTVLRTQTKINYKSGVAEDKSLRTSRLLKKGLKFNFNLSISEHNFVNIDSIFEDLDKICKVTLHFGSNRNRGFGHVKLNLSKKSNSEVLTLKNNNFQPDKVIDGVLNSKDDDLIEVNFYLLSKEPLIITPYVGLKNNTTFYIPGTMVLGALASIFIKNNELEKLAHQNQDFREIFLEDRVIFSNCYPINQSTNVKIRTIPVPRSLRKLKYGDKFVDLIIEDKPLNKNINIIEGFTFNTKLSEIGNQDIFHPSTTITYHFQSSIDKSKGATTEGGQNFFQYNSVDPEYVFSGSFCGKSKYIKKLINIFKRKESSSIKVRIGKSRSAQFGNGILKLIDYSLKNDKNDSKLTDKFLIYLESDLILINENGYPDPDPMLLIEEIKARMNLKENSMTIDECFIEKVEVGGFSGIWGLPKNQYPALKKGSILSIKSKNEIDLSKINFPYFGLKINEGFGKIQIVSNFEQISLNAKEPKKTSHSEGISNKVRNYVLKLLESYILDEIKEIAYKKVERFSQNYSSSELSRLKYFIVNVKKYSLFEKNLNDLSKSGKEKFRKFNDLLFMHTKEDKKFEINFREEIKKIFETQTLKDNLYCLFSKPITIEDLLSNEFKYYKSYYLNVLKILEWNLKKGVEN